jgi:hypothetical protein
MTRIDFRLPRPPGEQDSKLLKDLAKARAQPGMALMLNSDKAGAAAISGTVRLVKRSQFQRDDPQAYYSHAQARSTLRKLASGLVDARGQVQSGYMSLSADGQTLSNTSRWSSGDRSGAVDQIRQLLGQAYGHRMTELGMKGPLDAAINAYLSRSGGKLGTRSLVALVRDLEHKFAQDSELPQLPQVRQEHEAQSQALNRAQVGKARLKVESVKAQALPQDPDQAMQKLTELFEGQDSQLLAAEKAVIDSQYLWAEAKQVDDLPISHGHDDYRLTGFTDFKVMERLAQERGMAPQEFMTLLKRRGPDVLIDPAGQAHPAALGKLLHQNLRAAFQNAASLDEFHSAVSELGLKASEIMRAERAERADRAVPKTLPTFPAGSLEHSAVQALEDLGADRKLLRPQAPGPQGPVDWPEFAMPRWVDHEVAPAAQTLYRWGTGLLMSALHEQAGKYDMGALSDLLQRAAEQTLAGEAAILLSEELDQLIGEVPANSALAFGRDCLRESLGWLPSHTLPYRPESASESHPLTQLRRHPFLQSGRQSTN